jgi:CheY-like chemotaxis protein
MVKKKILVVEDEDDIREIMVKVLSQAGYDVSAAANGEDALQIAFKIEPDLIISDVLMPKKDGNQFYKELRQTSWGCQIPFIILTARGKMRDYFEVVAVDKFLEKPCPPAELIKTIEESLARAAAQKASAKTSVLDSIKTPPVQSKPQFKKTFKKGPSLKPKLLVIEPDWKFGEELCKWLIEYECCLLTSGKEMEEVSGFIPDLIVMKKDAPGIRDERDLNRIERKANADVIVYEKIGELDQQQKLVFNEEGKKLVWHINALAEELKNRK